MKEFINGNGNNIYDEITTNQALYFFGTAPIILSEQSVHPSVFNFLAEDHENF